MHKNTVMNTELVIEEYYLENIFVKEGEKRMSEEKECFVCKTMSYNQLDMNNYFSFFDCPICGRYQLSMFDGNIPFNKNHLGAYLAYHRYSGNNFREHRYNTMLSKEKCDEYKQDYQQGKNTHGLPVHMDEVMW